MSAYRYYIWKNGKFVSDCQRLSTVLSRLLKITRRSNPDFDEVSYHDTEKNEWFDASELVPSWKSKGQKEVEAAAK